MNSAMPSLNVLIVGASRGLGLALASAMLEDGHRVFGVSRGANPPEELAADARSGSLSWIGADFSDPRGAAASIAETLPPTLDVIFYNLGIWEETAFSEEYDFLGSGAEEVEALVTANVTGPLFLLHRLLPSLLASSHPRVILTGSTSGVPRSGRPEVAFGASKFALTGIADALREGYRQHRLSVSVLQLGFLNTEDPLSVPVEEAAARGAGTLIPVHDVVEVVRTMMRLSPASFVRELVLPAILDERF